MTTIRGSNPVATSCFPTPIQPSATPLPQMPSPIDQAAIERQQFNQACHVLKDNFGKLDGFNWNPFETNTIDMNELYKASNSSDPAVAQAAQFLLSHPEMVKELETRGNANPDGKISLGDLDKQINSLDRQGALEQLRYDGRLPQLQAALYAIGTNWNKVDSAGAGFWSMGDDGKISKKDLNAAAGDPNAPMELRYAALFLIQHPELFDLADTASKGGEKDGIVSIQDLQTLFDDVTKVANQNPPSFQTPYRTY